MLFLQPSSLLGNWMWRISSEAGALCKYLVAYHRASCQQFKVFQNTSLVLCVNQCKYKDELTVCQELSWEFEFVCGGMQLARDLMCVYYIYISSCLKSSTEKTKQNNCQGQSAGFKYICVCVCIRIQM